MSGFRVSVVIPVYNCRDLLLLCLARLSSQSLPSDEFEVVVVDDNSTDGSADAARSYATKAKYHLAVVRRNINEGPGAARNTGIENSSAPVIAFADADTEPQPQWLEEGLKMMEQGFDLVEGCTLVGSRELATPFTHQTHNDSPGGFPTCNMFVRRSSLEITGLFNTRFYDRKSRIHFREDSDFALRFVERGLKIGFAEKAVVIHRPLSPKWDRPIKLAMRYRHDRLLKQLHPDTYVEWTDRHSILGIKTARLRQKIYWGYIGGVIALVLSFVIGVTILPAFIWVAVFLIAIWWLHIRLMGFRALCSWQAWISLPIVSIVPFVFAGSLIAGFRLHPKLRANDLTRVTGEGDST